MAKATKERPKMGDLIKQLPTPATPIQEVRPVIQKATSGDEVRINFNAPADFAKRLKIHSAQSGKSIKEIMMEAYELYATQLSK